MYKIRIQIYVNKILIDIMLNHLYILLKLYPEKGWNWDFLSRNPNITMDIIRENPDTPERRRWDWGCLSTNPNITWDIIRDNPKRNWNWEWLIENKFNRDNAAKTIQRWYRGYSIRRKLKEHIHIDIKMRPGIGIEWFEWLEESKEMLDQINS